jgi:zonadhesin
MRAFSSGLQIKSIDLLYYFHISFSHVVSVQVNGEIVSIPYKEADFSVFYSGRKAYYVSSFGLTVTYDGAYRATVGVPPTYAGKMCGLCGNYDGNPINDLTLPNGTYVGNLPNGANLFGDSYVVEDSDPSKHR